MASSEDRVVRMVFDNTTFEKKIAETLTSLGKLNDSLKFSGATKGLQDIEAASQKVDFKTVSSGIENVSKGFIALSTIGITALSRLTSMAISSGTQIVKSLTLQPILDGFREYELNIGSIQTILANTASKGTTLDQVTDALDKLNKYADQTIYNFGQMAKNIGTFSAAGVDLQTSVDSIKGIANLAAVSGSSADQAATAMYQLSQAIASGTVKLIDWNSVVNAGMGGEVFQNALFESGKALRTLTDVPVDMTFQQWKEAGNSFRESLQDGWITAEVLTTTLSGFTGDMTEEMLLQKGFTEQQAANIMRMAATAKAAATEVKTFSQLMTTVKEAIGTSWADSFKILIGNFTEAKTLWTGVSNSIGTFISKSAEARNSLLQGWKDLGGRTQLLLSLKIAFQSIGEVLRAVGEAFRNVFPPATVSTLMDLTNGFSVLVAKMKPSVETIEKLTTIFEGFFSLLSIGWTVIKETIKFIGNLVKTVSSVFGGDLANSFVKVSEGIKNLQQNLVGEGKIAAFFERLTEVIKRPIVFLGELKDAIGDIFKFFNAEKGEEAIDLFGRIKDRFGELTGSFLKIDGIWESFKNTFDKITEFLEPVFEKIRAWFKDLGRRLGAGVTEGDYNALFDALSVTLLGGITALLAKFIKNGFSINFALGPEGFVKNIAATFEQLTGVLSAFQANIKANALLKIASAIAILTASVLVLSLINSENLAKALTAMAVGFGQLMASFSLFTKIISDPKTAASFTIASAGMVVLSSSILILAFAVRSLAKLSWEDLFKGLVGVTGLLVSLAVGVSLLSGSAIGMIPTGIGLLYIASALLVLSIPMKILASMSWEEMAKGLIGIAGGLTAITVAINFMPNGANMVAQGAGLILVASALNILSGAVAIFGNLKWETMGKGLLGVAVSLGLIAGAMALMPMTTPIIAAGLVLLGVSLLQIAFAVKVFSSMSWSEIARGMTAMAGSLIILAGGLFLLGQAGGGIFALSGAAVALGLLATVLKKFAELSWNEVFKALGAIGLTLLTIAISALALQPAIPIMLALGAALFVVGAGFALLGVGVFLLAKGLETLSKLGRTALENLTDVMLIFPVVIPRIAEAVAQGILSFIKVFSDAAPGLVKVINNLIGIILDGLNANLPKMVVLLDQILTEGIRILRQYGPQIMDAGLYLVMQLLKGVRDRIGEFIRVVSDIITNFLQEFRNAIPRVGKELADTIIQMFLTASYELGRVSGTILFGTGRAFLQGLLDGIDSQVGPLIDFWKNLANRILGWVGNVVSTLWQKGSDLIQGLINGINSTIENVVQFFINLPGNILGWIGNVAETLWRTGIDIIQGFIDGVIYMWSTAISWIRDIPGRILEAFPNPIAMLFQTGIDIAEGLLRGIQKIWSTIVDWVKDKVKSLIETIKAPWEIFSPSRVMTRIGENIMEGWLIGFQQGYKPVDKFMTNLGVDRVEEIKNNMIRNMLLPVSEVAKRLEELPEFQPTITPVLDLTQVEQGAMGIGKIISQRNNTMAVELSNGHAQAIAMSTKDIKEPTYNTDVPKTGDVKFEQNIYAPTRLSTSDIYKQTRNQITIAKEELRIP